MSKIIKSKKIIKKKEVSSSEESEIETSSSEDEKETIRNKKVVKRDTDINYIKLTQHEHVIKRSVIYLGSNVPKKEAIWIKSKNKIEKKEVTFTDAIIRVFIEPLSNAMDNIFRSKQRDIKQSQIRIYLNPETGESSVYNDGECIRIKKYIENKGTSKEIKHDYYQHQLIFGELNSGSNYDEKEDKQTSGQNGLGIKLLNIFSKRFKVESYDPLIESLYTQEWSDNMYTRNEPVIEKLNKTKIKELKLPKSSGYTKISWILDFEKLGMKKYTPDLISIYLKFIHDIAMISSQDNVSVYYNDELIEVNSLKDYAFLYFDKVPENYIEFNSKDSEVILCPYFGNDFLHMSFVNGICTYNGGVHVDKWSKEILTPVTNKINGVRIIKPKIKPKIKDDEEEKKEKKTSLEKEKEKKKKEAAKKKKEKLKDEKQTIELKEVKKYFAIFINCKVTNPDFESQEKTKLTKPEITTKIKTTDITKIMKWNIIEQIKSKLNLKDLKKLDSISKNKEPLLCLDDANYTKIKSKQKDCILCLTEGSSAREFVVQGANYGINGKVGRNYIGILKCKGNFLNIRGINNVSKIIEKNTEAKALIRALNLKAGLDYTDPVAFKTLRYGSFIAVSDSDLDGKHICALWFNFLECFNSSLLKIPGFFSYMRTPIITINSKIVSMNRMFYFEEQSRKYISENNISPGDIERFKGLGSHRLETIDKIFGKKIVEIVYESDSLEKLNLIFGKENADFRKVWIGTIDEVEENFEDRDKITITEFLDYEMKDFSIDHCKRAIPGVYDGFVEGQRKIMFTAFLRNLKKPLKVAQFAGVVAEKSCYAHGEQILYDTIIHLAQTFVGSNNISLLFPDGSFGSRDMMGKNAASARYIHTFLDKLTRLIFKIEDEKYLENREEEGTVVEKKFYIPIIPMLLVNGSKGIATGYSTTIPSFNPIDIINWIRNHLKVKSGDENKESIESEDESNSESEEESEEDSDREEKSESEDEKPKKKVIKKVNIKNPSFHPWYRGFKGDIVPEIKNGVNTGSYISYGKMEFVKEGHYRITELPVGFRNTGIDDYRIYLDGLEEVGKIKTYDKHSGGNMINFLIVENPEELSIDLSTEKSTRKTLEKFKLSDKINTSNMTAFRTKFKPHDQIIKYKNVDEIMIDFCDMRFKKYEERIEGDIIQIKFDIEILKCKIRFIDEVNNATITLKNISDEDLDKILVEKKYIRNNKLNTEEDQEEDSKFLKGYSYLVNMTYRSATKKKQDTFKKELDKLIDKLNYLLKLTPSQLWLDELEVLEKEYLIWEKITNTNLFTIKPRTVTKKNEKKL
jgi:DNA topoisomerase-2